MASQAPRLAPQKRVHRSPGTQRLATMLRPRQLRQFARAANLTDAGLDADAIVETVLKALRHNSAGVIEGARA